MDLQSERSISTKRHNIMKPLVSFITPFFNAEKFITETIDSVLNCGYDMFELILVDDGSTDQSLEICRGFAEKSPKIRVLKHPSGVNKGVSTSRKVGIEEAKGEFIYFLDSDDIILPGMLSQYIDFFYKHADVVLIHGEIMVKNLPAGARNLEHDFIIGYTDRKYRLQVEPYYLKSNRICNSTVCVRKKILEGIDFDYRQSLPLGEDWVLWNLLALKGSFYYLARPVIKYRVHEKSATSYAIQKGQIFMQYNLIENYLCLMAKTTDKQLKQKVKENLLDLINELYKSYQSKSLPNNSEQGVFNDLTPNTELVLSLKKKINNLEKGYGYYFYFIYILKKFLSKLSLKK